MPSYPATILAESSLVSYWKLNEVSGTTAVDSKSSNHGTYIGDYSLDEELTTTWIKGVYQPNNTYEIYDQQKDIMYSLQELSPDVLFDGATGYIEVPDSSSLHLSNVTLEAWVNLHYNILPDGIGPNRFSPDIKLRMAAPNGQIYYNPVNMVMFKGNIAGSGFGLGITNGYIKVYVGTEIWYVEFPVKAFSQPTLYQDIFRGSYYVAVTISSSGQIIVYLNGRVHWIKNVAISLSNTQSLYIGRSGNANNYFNGYLMHCAIYNTVLSHEAIIKHYLAGRVKDFDIFIDSEPNKISDYRLNDNFKLIARYTGSSLNIITDSAYDFESNNDGTFYYLGNIKPVDRIKSEYVIIPQNSSLNLVNNFTIELLINIIYSGHDYVPGTVDNHAWFYKFNPVDQSGWLFFINGAFGFQIWTGIEWLYASLEVPDFELVPVTMQHLVLTVSSGGIIKFYCNGVDIALYHYVGSTLTLVTGALTTNFYNTEDIMLGSDDLYDYFHIYLRSRKLLSDKYNLIFYTGVMDRRTALKHYIRSTSLSPYKMLILSETSLVAFWPIIFSYTTPNGTNTSLVLDINYNVNTGFNNGFVSTSFISNVDIVVPNSISLQSFTNFSIELWISIPYDIDNDVDFKDLGEYLILSKVNSSGHGFAIEVNNNFYRFYGGGGWVDSGIELFDGNVHHIVATVSSLGDVKLYVDGSLKKSVNMVVNLNSIGSDLIFYKHNPTMGPLRAADILPYDLKQYECAIYNAVLSPTQILSHYEAGTVGHSELSVSRQLDSAITGSYLNRTTQYSVDIMSEPTLISYWQFDWGLEVNQDYKFNNDAYSNNETEHTGNFLGPRWGTHVVPIGQYVYNPFYYYVVFDHANMHFTKLSMEAWIVTSSNDQGVLFSKFDPLLPCNGFSLCVKDGNIGVYAGGDADPGTVIIKNKGTGDNPQFSTGVTDVNVNVNLPNYVYSASKIYNDGQLHHIVATIADTGEINIYGDGINILNTTVVPHLLNTEILRIGAESTSPPINTTNQNPNSIHVFNGYISHFAIYNDVLDLTQVSNHYGSGNAYIRDYVERATGVHYDPAEFIQPELTYTQTILNEPSLISYWKLDETSGTLARDFQNFNNGTYTGTYTLNQTGNIALRKSVNLNGGYIVIPDSITLHTTSQAFPFSTFNTLPNGVEYPITLAGLTLELWVKIPSTLGSHLLLSKYNGGTGFALRVNNHLLEFYNGLEWLITYGLNIDDNKWHHIVVTYFDHFNDLTRTYTSFNFYWDGKQTGFRNVTYNLENTIDDLVIGAQSDGSNNVIANISQVAIYSQTLNAITIFNHYRVGLLAIPPTVERHEKYDFLELSGEVD